MHQKTLSRTVKFSGIGLHSGEVVNVTLKPSSRGIFFNNIRADVNTVRGSALCTQVHPSLGDSGYPISTIEHLMCALFVLGIDNVEITLDGYEIPVLDGSAWPFYEMLKDYVKVLDKEKTPVRACELMVKDSDKFIRVLPSETFSCTLDVDFDGLVQSYTYNPDDLEFLKARTFCFLSDVEEMQRNGLALGGSLKNAVVIDHTRYNKVLNPEGLRFENELAMHKMVDFLGDLYTIQNGVLGAFTCHKPGHRLNNQMVREISKYCIEPECL